MFPTLFTRSTFYVSDEACTWLFTAKATKPQLGLLEKKSFNQTLNCRLFYGQRRWDPECFPPFVCYIKWFNSQILMPSFLSRWESDWVLRPILKPPLKSFGCKCFSIIIKNLCAGQLKNWKDNGTLIGWRVIVFP